MNPARLQSFLSEYWKSCHGNKLSDRGFASKFPDLDRNEIRTLISLFIGARYCPRSDRESLRAEAVRLRRAGMLVREIAKRLGVNAHYVSDWTKDNSTETLV